MLTLVNWRNSDITRPVRSKGVAFTTKILTIVAPSLAMGDFLALRFDICSQTDPLSNIELLQNTCGTQIEIPVSRKLNRDGNCDRLGRLCARNVFAAWINKVAADENGWGRKEWVRDELLHLSCDATWCGTTCTVTKTCRVYSRKTSCQYKNDSLESTWKGALEEVN